MTDTDNAAPASADTAVATSDAVANGSQNTAPVTDWTAALPEDTRATVAAKGWKSPADAVKSYRDLMRDYTETKTKAIVPPGDNAKPEDWAAFYGKLGRPESADAYEFKLPEGIPPEFPYDATAASKFKSWAHEAGATPRQAQVLHDNFVKDMAGKVAEMQAANTAKATQSHEALVKAWGDPESTTYQRNQEFANRAIRQQGGSELLSELQSLGALGPNGEVMTPHIAKAFAKIGESLYAEDSLYSGPTGGPNPFSPKSENLQAQGEIIRNDPERARALIRQAGIDPKEYRL